MKHFNPTSKNSIRAKQAWQILVGAAMNRQTLTYFQLSELMYKKPAPGVLDKILGHVAFYCNDNGLPILTCIVVNQTTGIPGQDIPMSAKKFNSERERVYSTDWYDIFPPSSKLLEASYASNVK